MGRVGFGPTTPRFLLGDFKGCPLTSAVCSPRLSYDGTARSGTAEIGADAVLLVPAATEVARNRDVHYPFRQDSDFAYLTGFPEPDARLSRRALVALNAAIVGEVLGQRARGDRGRARSHRRKDQQGLG